MHKTVHKQFYLTIILLNKHIGLNGNVGVKYVSKKSTEIDIHRIYAVNKQRFNGFVNKKEKKVS